MSFPPRPPPALITFGSDANCTLALCPIEWSVYEYRPSLGANITFLVLFSLAMAVHILLGFRWQSKAFMSFMILGCLLEIGGYAGRIVLYHNPWSFGGFISQVVLITCGPIFYTAAIYVTLSRTIRALDPLASRVKPELLYYIFIPVDVVCLVLQAAGGAMSTVSSGKSQTGVDVALAGLGLQVAALAVFCVVFADYMVRYLSRRPLSTLGTRMRLFLGFLAAAVVLILLRCIYRCYELSKGYVRSDLITNQGLFIGLEGVPVILAVAALCVGHPGLVFGRGSTSESSGSVFEERSDLYRRSK